MYKHIKTQKGFTLIELLVAVSIFIIIVTMAMGSLVVVFETNRQTAAIRLALDNANFALNSMSREIRLGTGFKCNGGVCDGDDQITFKFFGDTITYRKTSANIIEKQSNTGAPWLPLTADRYDVTSLQFTQTETSPDFISIHVSGTAVVGEQSTDFELQTGVSSRQFVSS